MDSTKPEFAKVEAMQTMTRLSSSQGATCIGLQERQDTSLVLPSSAEPLNAMPQQLSPVHIVEGKFYPPVRGGVPNRNNMIRVPVVDAEQKPLMPCTAIRARTLLTAGKAIARRSKIGVFYIQLKTAKTPDNQPVVLGVDPGSKFEGYSVVGTKDTILNIMCEATTWVHFAMCQRRSMRSNRRCRNLRQRKCRSLNRSLNPHYVPPSTKSRWDTKLRIITNIEKIIPINRIIVEDVKASFKRKQNRLHHNFAAVEVGKHYFYQQINRPLCLRQGYETQKYRNMFGLKKTMNKSKAVFETHCVDAWVLAASLSGASQPTTHSIYYMAPIKLHRRQLHRLQPTKGGKRFPFGGTVSHGLVRGTLVISNRYGLCYIGGCPEDKVSLHSLIDGKRLTHNALKQDTARLTRISFRSHYYNYQKNKYSKDR